MRAPPDIQSLLPNRATSEKPVIGQDLAIFTIAASNYLAQASVLGASVHEHHPELKLIVFMLDAPPPGLPVPAHLTLIPAEQAFTRREWNHRRAHYDILEFATSVKPACFRHLFDQGARRVIYLDPDIRLFQPLDQFWRGDESDDALVLTPHILSPLPNDGCRPDDLAILRAGLYNLGFAALRDTADARALLDWWDHKLHRHCLQDVREGVFTDQKWMDYAPLMLRSSAVLAHPGFNVAYWNLHERIPRRIDGRWQVENAAGRSRHDLVFFHFSGFAPGQDRISRHEDRFGANAPGDAAELFSDYAQALSNAGARRFLALDTPRARFRDGTCWDDVCRHLYRQGLAEEMEFGDPLDDADFRDWAMGVAPGDQVARYVRTVLRLRTDVAAAYDDGHNMAGLLAWLRSSGVSEMGLDGGLIENLARGAGSDAECINYVGYLRSHLGIGEAARQSIAALQDVGVAVRAHDISATAGAPVGDYAVPTANAQTAARVTVLGCNADVLPSVLAALPRDLLDTYRIGCWYWETPSFPEPWTDRFDLVDEVWVASQFVADAIREKATVPVVVMPPMVRPAWPRHSRHDRAWLTTLLPEITPGEFVFLFQFDMASVAFRKNPEGVVSAFKQAFIAQEPVRLVLKVLNGQRDPTLMDKLRRAAAGQRISVVDHALESRDNQRLLHAADCFVSLHRSEGFGLSIAEAMACGIPVVATGWSGNADFTNPDNCALVPYDLVTSTQPHGPYPAGTLWAEPRLDVAAQLMRRVWTDKAWREGLAQAGAATIEQRYGAATVGRAMRERILRIERSAKVQVRRNGVPASNSPHPANTPAPVRSRSSVGRIFFDVLRFPGYYISRLPRLPGLLWRSGITDTLVLAEEVATRPPTVKQQYGLLSIPRNWWERWRCWRAARSDRPRRPRKG